ncbi:hypothetical protein O181_119279 [Austropuccinia psidii MF-1]|uniref:Uncharacterized protein n=1 Tax=Austropuccinia psidii MF-1 TaxID=1389203 RepID=A0A9Q3KGV4_9BASI|nr:hypothetical protein [Austropuccinia psidii MF-1]
MIPKSRSQNPTPILKEDSSAHQSGNPWRLSEDYSRITTTWPCRSWVGSSIQDYSKGHFSGVLHHFNQLSGQQYSSIPWTIKSVHTGNTQVSCMALAQLGQFIPTVQFSRWPELYWPNPDNTASDSPSRISPSAFHIYWPPFITWGFFPQLLNILDLFVSSFLFSFMKLNTDILKSAVCTFLLCLSVDIGGHILY